MMELNRKTAPRAAPITVSLIATVLNERDSIREWLNLLKTQTRQPDEIVICDGGSSDGTAEELAAYARDNPQPPLKIISRPGVNIAAGRNAAIEQAAHEIIAVGDAGSRPEPNWLEQLIKPLAQDSKAHAVAGSYRFMEDTRFRRAAAAYLGRPWESASFSPSSRSIAFTKEAWKIVGGYPEWLTLAAEDSLFNRQLRVAGIHFSPAPEAIVHWNTRPTLASFLKMIGRNAFGDAEAGLGFNSAIKSVGRLMVYVMVLIAITWTGALRVGPLAAVFVALLIFLALAARAAVRGAPLRSWPEFFALTLFGGPAYLRGYARGLLFGKKRPERRRYGAA